ncbi:MAG TPA: KUP/HAK/KT family potassium transporter, partial [Kofleriaceae bacterium]
MNRARSPREVAALSLGALGVVYGDIGTSPLYTIRECVYGPHAVPVNEANVYGILSLILWSLILVVALKYLVFILRADNEGEG